MPWLILGFFCGIRTAEINRLSWESVKWDAKTPKIRIEMPKGHLNGCKPRLVTLNEAAFSWLSLYRKDSGPIGYAERKFLRWKHTLKNYPKKSHNVMRHTFASAHYAMFDDLYKTAKELGHYQNTQTSLNHYIGLMQDEDAEEFWALRPPVQAVGNEVTVSVPQEHPEVVQESKDGQDTLLPCLPHEGILIASAI